MWRRDAQAGLAVERSRGDRRPTPRPAPPRRATLPHAMQKLRSRPLTSTYTRSEAVSTRLQSASPDGRVRGGVRACAAAQRAMADDDVAQRPVDLEAHGSAEAAAGNRLAAHPAISSSSAALTSASGQLYPPPRLSGRVQQDEARPAARGLLVAAERRPGDVAVDRRSPRRQHALDGAPLLLETRQPERGEHPERHRLAVRQLVAGRGLEGVAEGVTEVELVSRASIVWVTKADGPLEDGAAAHLVVLRELPQRLPGEQSRLDHLGEAVAPLLLRRASPAASGRRRRVQASGRRRRGSSRAPGRRRSCRRSRRPPGRRESSGRPPTERRACRSQRRNPPRPSSCRRPVRRRRRRARC